MQIDNKQIGSFMYMYVSVCYDGFLIDRFKLTSNIFERCFIVLRGGGQSCFATNIITTNFEK